MSLKYRDKNGAEHVLAGLTPGGDIEYGAVATRRGTITVPELGASGSTMISVTFSDTMPDDDYIVDLDLDDPAQSGYGIPYTIATRDRTVNGFNVSIINPTSGQHSSRKLKWVAYKLYTVADAEALYSTVQDMQKAFPADASSSNKLATIHDVTGETRSLDRRLDDVEDVIPSDATLQNKLATADDVAEAMANAGLKVTDTIPTSPQDGDVLLYIGTETGFSKGGIYQYVADPGAWILISTADVDLTCYETSWTGTKAAWEALSSSEKDKYTLVNITDDISAQTVVDAIVNGEMRPVTSNAVFDLINQIATESINVSVGSGTLIFKKTGKVVSVYGYITGLPSSTTEVLGTVPEGFRPINSYCAASAFQGIEPYIPIGSIWFYSAGMIRIYKTATYTTTYIFATYVSA